MALHRRPKIGPSTKLRKPNKFHIDYKWWGRTERELTVYMQSHLCDEHQAMYANYSGQEVIDWIDPRTAEVRQVNGLEHTLHTHCSLQPEYITPNTSLIDAIFRVFLANGNSPLTSEELAGRTGQRATVIEKTLSGNRVYKGIRPVLDDDEV